MARNRRPRIYDQDHSAREGEPLAVQVIATDRNPGDTLTYSIVSGNGQGLFEIDPLTGIITRADGGAFDFETDPTRYDLRVRVTDDGNPPKSRTADVTIRITDVNDAPNEITVSNLSVDENAAGAAIGTVAVADQDDNGHILAVDDARFEIVGDLLKLKDGVALDHEAGDAVTVTVTATDPGGASLSQSFAVVVGDLDEAPTGIVLSNATIAESVAGATIGMLSVTDPDDSAEPFGAYAFLVDDARFEVADGALKLRADVSLDHETEASVTVGVTATAADGTSISDTFTIVVSDVNEAPTAISLSNDALPEGRYGGPIGVLSVTDGDQPGTANGTHGFSVDDARFEVVNGILRLKHSERLDHEAEESVTVTVTATDGGGESVSQIFTIRVTDVNEAPVVPSASFTVDELLPAGSLVGSYRASDPDDPDTPFGTLTYSLSSDGGGRFAIDAAGDIFTTVPLDHDEATSHTLQVRVVDGGGLARSSAVTVNVVDVNEAPTDLTISTGPVFEEATGATIGSVFAYDPDNYGSPFGQLSYTVDDERFEVDAGRLKLKDGVALDHEPEPSVTLTVTATDGGGLSTSQTVTVQVSDVLEGQTFIDLGALDGGNGVTLTSALPDAYLGLGVSGAGDVNGDGYADVIVSAPFWDDPRMSGAGAGAQFVLFGKAGGWNAELDLSALDGTQGFRLSGAEAYANESPSSVAAAGDINGDGYDDIIVTSLNTANLVGVPTSESYVVFGGGGGFPADIDLSALDGSDGFRLVSDGTAYSYDQMARGAGDLNGDGIDDLVVTVDSGVTDTPQTYVVYGSAAGWSPTVDLGSLDGSNGFGLVSGSGPGSLGGTVAGLGDVNGDGYDDIIVGGPAYAGGPMGPEQGDAFVVFGGPDAGAVVDVDALDGSNGFTVTDSGGYDFARSLSGGGDINGDGIDDFVISRPGGLPFLGEAEGTYAAIVYGQAGGWGAAFDLAGLDGSNGFWVHGEALPYSAVSVSIAGDLNGDGYDDVLVGSPFASVDGAESGSVYVVYGGAHGLEAGFSLDTIDGYNGFRLDAADPESYTGFSVSGAGDVNGDGFDDLLVGAPTANQTGWQADGEAYIVFGGDFASAVTMLGTDAADTLAGTAAADSLIGAQGEDLLVGQGGADVLYGGAGDDILAVGDLGFARIDGGSGTDTLRLDGAGQALDLTATGNARIEGVERIDLTGSGDNSATLAMTDLLQLSDEGNDLFVAGDAGDRVTVVGDWQNTGPATVDGVTYDVFSVAGVEAALYVEDDVTVTVAGIVGV